MHKRQDGRFLRTTVVATLGALSHEMYDPDGMRTKEFNGEERDWDEFLGWFMKDDGFMIDVLRLNMSFYQPLPSGEADPACKELTILRWLRSHAQELRNVALLGDLPGPKLRLLGVGSDIALSAGETVELMLAGDLSRPTVCAYGEPIGDVDGGIAGRLEGLLKAEGEPLISIGDGVAVLKLVGVAPGAVTCVVEEDGYLGERKGVTFKGFALDLTTFQEDDEQAVDFLLEHAVDWDEHSWEKNSSGSFLSFFALSFVRSAEDVERARRYIEDRVTELLRPHFGHLGEDALRKEARNFAPGVIAKIETADATRDIERILDAADGAMVARGDLALQIGPHNVPGFQKRLIRLCNLRGKPVITATQMLSSMVGRPEPTRAEASDVFNAILDGTDAVMLSDETASGRYPFQSVRTMIEIAEAAENHLAGRTGGGHDSPASRRRSEERRAREMIAESELETRMQRARLTVALERARSAADDWLEAFYAEKLDRCLAQKVTDEISAAACSFASSDVDYAAIVAPTTSGRTVRMIARFRPGVPILGCAHDVLNRKKLLLTFGVYTVNIGRMAEGRDDLLIDTGSVFRACSEALRSEGVLATGDLVVWTAGSSLFVPGTTNLIEIRRVD